MTALDKVLAMEPRERDAEIAVRLFGYSKQDHWHGERDNPMYLVSEKGVLDGWWLTDGEFVPHAWTYLKCYSTDPEADYEVLRKVRTFWEDDRFHPFLDAANALWQARMDNSKEYGDQEPWSCYEPGDYSIAALATLLESEREG